MAKTIWIISQYASTPESGMGGRHYYMAREMVRRGYNVYVIAAGYTHLLRKPMEMNKSFIVQTVDGINFVWVKTRTYRTAHDMWRVFNWFWFSFQLRRLPKIIPHRPDAVLISSPSLLAFLGAESVARRLKARLVFEVRDIWPLTLVELGGYSVRHPFIRLLQWVEDRAYRISDHVISNLPNVEAHMQARGLTPGKFTWVGNGFSLEELAHPQPLATGILTQLPKECLLVGYAGTLGVANALDALLDAAALLQAKGVNVAFVLLGKGKEKARLQQRAKNENLRNVVFLDPIPKNQVQSFLGVMDVCYLGLVDSRLYEHGIALNKLFDYLYSKKPIVFSGTTGDYRPVEAAGAGISVPAEDAVAIAEAITQLLELSQNERETMGVKGRTYVVEKHEYGMLAEKLVRVLNGNNDV